jgi:hypothetical protein
MLKTMFAVMLAAAFMHAGGVAHASPANCVGVFPGSPQAAQCATDQKIDQQGPSYDDSADPCAGGAQEAGQKCPPPDPCKGLTGMAWVECNMPKLPGTG